MIILKTDGFRWRQKVALIDFDWTLVRPKGESRTFPKDVDDWQWLRPSVPEVVRARFYDAKHCVVIVTNQTKEWKQEQIKAVMEALEIPCMAFVLTDKKTEHKPNSAFFKEHVSERKFDAAGSLFVGDALGRKNDHSDSDKAFALAVGISADRIFAPEDVFPAAATEAAARKKNNDKKGKSKKAKGDDDFAFDYSNLKLAKKHIQEVVVMVGFPGSGKSTLADRAFGSHTDQGGSNRYAIVRGDDHKSSTPKMLKAAAAHVEAGLSVVFDATSPTAAKRAAYVEFANERGLPARCIHVATDMVESMARNNKREHPVPRIVYNVYKKRFEPPSEASEGFSAVLTIVT